MGADNDMSMRSDWRQRLKLIGKDAFIREEMTRLGFWPPDEATRQRAEAAESELKLLYEELAKLRAELAPVEEQLSAAQDVAKLLEEIRRRRIERVRAKREERRKERARKRKARQARDREWRQKTLPFLGHGVSGGLKYEDGDPAKVESLGLPPLATASDLAAAIGIAERELAWLTYHRGAAAVDHYHRFQIPKRGGGMRGISSPKRRLRVAQRWVLNSLLSRLPVHDAAMAFRPKRSIVVNAAKHVKPGLLLKLDLKDFFPSIGFRRVKGLFESFGYNEGVASLLALLTTEAPRVAAALDGERKYVAVGQRQLPQGACTSPALTNLLCRRMDARLSGAAKSHGFAYTRYADDLTFSHPAPETAAVGALLALVRQIVENEGYTVNEAKTAVMRPQHRQVVTGLVVNETPRVSRRDVRRFRAFLHGCKTLGAEEMSRRLGRNAQAYAAGYLSFLHMVSPEQEEKIHRAHPWLVRWHKTG
jgi:RNA-directed DNA polymerase